MPAYDSSKRRKYSSASSKYGRKKMVSTKRAASTMLFVPRSVGNPRAVTERKYFDSQYSAAVGATTTSFASAEADPTTLNTLFAPTQGDDFNQRTGRKVQVLSIKVMGHISCAAQADQTGADPASLIRLLLVQDKQTNAQQLNSEDVISSGDGSQAVNFFQNPAFFGRFRVLKDKRIVMQNPTMSYDGTNIEQAGLTRTFKISVKFRKPVVIHYNSTNGGTVADVVDNSFHILAGTNGLGLGCVLNYKVRTVFLDA